jgi:ferric-dicitrate binding protein FerR (iron transport regulator)
MSLQEARQFVARFEKGEYTPTEHAAFLQWLEGATAEELTIIADTHESYYGEWVLPAGPTSEWMLRIEQKLDAVDDAQEEQISKDDRDGLVAPVIPMATTRLVRWKAWMAAAAIVAVSAGSYLYIHQQSSGSGIVKGQKQLLAKAFETPRGVKQKEFVLEDGSKVWLNAGSVLKYPAHFADNERLVELSGEAFFDVSGSAERPFRVLIKDAEVEVLGTYFTIMAYDDEPESRTTVVDGAVKLISEVKNVVLNPGEQAELVYPSAGVGTEIVVHSGIDIEAIKAWKGGIYRFVRKDLKTVMRELERVYNVHVQYQPNVGNPVLDGIIDLNKGLDIVLKQLEGSLYEKPNIHFTHNGNTVIASSV